MSPRFRAHPSIVIVADWIVVLPGWVIRTSLSVTDIAGPPAVYVAVASAPLPVVSLASRSRAGGAAIGFDVISMKAVPFLLQLWPS